MDDSCDLVVHNSTSAGGQEVEVHVAASKDGLGCLQKNSFELVCGIEMSRKTLVIKMSHVNIDVPSYMQT